VEKETPMQRQYREFREKLAEGTILLFRLGDFYEVFGHDAEVAAKVLGLTLTKRHETPMAGLPHHAAPAYVNRLLAAGWKVAPAEERSPVVIGNRATHIWTHGDLAPGRNRERGTRSGLCHRQQRYKGERQGNDSRNKGSRQTAHT
jgi:hypothetical protein